MTFPRTLEEQMIAIFSRIGEIERRARNRKRTGKIADVDHKKGLARVELSKPDGKSFKTGWIPWKEIAAGGIKSHIPPSVGEQVDVVSENGDMTDAIIDMSTPSNENKRPHDGPEAVLVMGSTRLTISDGAVEIVSNVTIKGDLSVEGSALTHNGTNVGETHQHDGVLPGGGLTGEPV